MAAVFGFLTGLFGAVSLLAFGVVPVDSAIVTVLPVVTLVIAFALAMWAPIGRSRQPPAGSADSPQDDSGSSV
jgi:hypothetical protein